MKVGTKLNPNDKKQLEILKVHLHMNYRFIPSSQLSCAVYVLLIGFGS